MRRKVNLLRQPVKKDQIKIESNEKGKHGSELSTDMMENGPRGSLHTIKGMQIHFG